MAKSDPTPPPTTGDSESIPRRTLRRSPNFPYIDLPTAIMRIRTLYSHEHRNPTPWSVVAGHWDYSASSSSMDKTVGALNAYGLVDVAGAGDARTVKLSKRALDIVEDEREESPDRTRAIQDAALAPSIFKTIRDRFGNNLPSDASLRTVLVRELDFNPNAVGSVITNYRNTIEHSGLDKSDSTAHAGGADRKPSKTDDVRPVIGDWVQWTSQGVAQFPTPRQVIGIDEQDGEHFVRIRGDDGSEGWVPMNQVTIESPPTTSEPPRQRQSRFAPPVISASMPPERTPPGVREFSFPLIDGVATLRIPHPMGDANYNLLVAVLNATKAALTGAAAPDKSSRPNRRMIEMVEAGEAIDVRSIGSEIRPGVFKMPVDFCREDGDADLCDLREGRWIWSVGKHKSTGEVFASCAGEFYQNPEYECLFLR